MSILTIQDVITNEIIGSVPFLDLPRKSNLASRQLEAPSAEDVMPALRLDDQDTLIGKILSNIFQLQFQIEILNLKKLRLYDLV